jgi:hypothetical protein
MSSPENVRPAMAPVCQLVRETRVCPTSSEISWLNAPSLEPRRRSLAGCDRRLPAHSRQSASVQTSLRWTGRGPARRTPSRLPPTRSPRPHPTRRGTVPRRPPRQRQTNPRLTRIPADPSSFAGFSLGRLAVRKASPCRAELIWSAVLMPSMRLSPGVQNSGSVPVRAAPRSRADAKQADSLPRDGDPRARCRDPFSLRSFKDSPDWRAAHCLMHPWQPILELATVPVRSSPAVDALGAEVPEAFLRLPAAPPSCS